MSLLKGKICSLGSSTSQKTFISLDNSTKLLTVLHSFNHNQKTRQQNWIKRCALNVRNSHSSAAMSAWIAFASRVSKHRTVTSAGKITSCSIKLSHQRTDSTFSFPDIFALIMGTSERSTATIATSRSALIVSQLTAITHSKT